jgi:DNA polymerase I-like protein with 3'-5' exonuclease and polymerase domains
MFNYIEKEDGRIGRTGFSQLVPTGSRMSSSKPNMQLLLLAIQKNVCCKPGWKFVDSDYSSQNCLPAYLSGDKQLMFTIRQGYDLHSYSSFLIFGQSG